LLSWSSMSPPYIYIYISDSIDYFSFEQIYFLTTDCNSLFILVSIESTLALFSWKSCSCSLFSFASP
jgi:uncharacterized membrane protein